MGRDAGLTKMLGMVEKRFQGLVRHAGRVSAQAQAIGKGMVAGGVAAGAGLAPAVLAFTNFDDAIRAAAARAEATPAQFDAMREKALELGKTMSYTATEVANTMNTLATGGFDPVEINKMTAAVLNLARASGDEAPIAGQILAATLKQFGVGADHAAAYADKLTVASIKSAVSLVDLSESLKYVGPEAKKLGMSVDKTLAIAGALGNMGIKGENAGTAMRRLGNLLADMQPKLDKLGIKVSVLDAVGSLRPMEDVLDDIRVALDGVGEGDKISILQELFGLMGVTAASAIGMSVKSIGELEKAIGKASEGMGSAAKTAAFMDAGLGGSFRRLRGSVENAAIAIGDALAPTLGLVAKLAKDAAAGISEWVRNNRELAVSIGMASVALLGLVAAGAAVLALGAVIKVALAPVMLLASGVKLLFAGLSAGAAVVGTAFGLLGGALRLVLVPLKLLSSGLAALRAGAVAVGALSAAFGVLRVVATGAAAAVRAIGAAALAVRAIGLVFAAAMVPVALLSAGVAALGPVLGAVASALGFLFSPIPLAVIAVTGLILAFRHFGDEIKGGLNGAAGLLADFFAPLAESATTAFGHVADIATAAWGGIQAAVKKGDMELAFRIAGQGLKAVWLELMFFLREQFEDFTSWWRNKWEDATDWLAKKLADAHDVIAFKDDPLAPIAVVFGGWMGKDMDELRKKGARPEVLGDAVRADAALAEKERKARQAREKKEALDRIRAEADAARAELDDLIKKAEAGVVVIDNKAVDDELDKAKKPPPLPPKSLRPAFKEVRGAMTVLPTARQQFGFGSNRTEDEIAKNGIEQLKEQQKIRLAVEGQRVLAEEGNKVMNGLAAAFRLR